MSCYVTCFIPKSPKIQRVTLNKKIRMFKKTCALLEAFKPKRNVVTGCPI